MGRAACAVQVARAPGCPCDVSSPLLTPLAVRCLANMPTWSPPVGAGERGRLCLPVALSCTQPRLGREAGGRAPAPGAPPGSRHSAETGGVRAVARRTSCQPSAAASPAARLCWQRGWWPQGTSTRIRLRQQVQRPGSSRCRPPCAQRDGAFAGKSTRVPGQRHGNMVSGSQPSGADEAWALQHWQSVNTCSKVRPVAGTQQSISGREAAGHAQMAPYSVQAPSAWMWCTIHDHGGARP